MNYFSAPVSAILNRSYSKGGFGSSTSKTSKKGPPGISPNQETGVKVVFHTIVSPEFKFDVEKHEVVVRMGGKDFGNFEADCVKMQVIRYGVHSVNKSMAVLIYDLAFMIAPGLSCFNACRHKCFAITFNIIQCDAI